MTSQIKTTPLGEISTPTGSAYSTTAPIGSEEIQSDMPELKIAKPIKIPNGVASNAKQHVIFVRDTSSSMSGPKINELNLAGNGLVAELANPENKDVFLGSVVDFSSSATRIVFAELVTKMRLPAAVAGGGTNFDQAIDETIKAIEEFKAQPNPDGWRFLRPHVIFLSDGQSSVDTMLIGDLQEIATVTAVAYGSDANASTLSKIASDGQVHVVGTNGGELRQFLAAVGQTLSQEFAKK